MLTMREATLTLRDQMSLFFACIAHQSATLDALAAASLRCGGEVRSEAADVIVSDGRGGDGFAPYFAP